MKDQQIHFSVMDILYFIFVTNMFWPVLGPLKRVGDNNTVKVHQ